MATQEAFDRVIAELTEICNFDTISEAVSLLNILEYGKTDDTDMYFIDFVKNLPVLNTDTKVAVQNGLPIKMIKGIRRKTKNVLSLEKKSGAWGTVTSGQTYVYKDVDAPNARDKRGLNNYYRDVLTEILIQVILSCDTVHGDKVPKIINIYKQTPHSNSIIIQMEKYDMTFINYINTNLPSLNTLEIIFTDLCTAFEYFQETYKFNHKDMKADNLMMKENKIKFIDFGYSILKFNNKQYSAKLYGAYDVLYFSKVQDLLFLSLYLKEAIFIKSVGDRRREVVNKQIGNNSQETTKFYQFLNTVIKNIPSVTAPNIKFDVRGYTEVLNMKDSSSILEIIAHKKALRLFQVGYNWKGEYLNGQFEFPFATPRGFLDLYKKASEKIIDPDEYVTSILYPTEDKPKEGGKRRKNRKTMKKRTT